jgi:hypothetical protein
MMGWQDDPVVQGKWESDPIIDPAPSTLATAPAVPVIEISADGQAPQLLQPSVNPYSGGLYPLARNYTVGDKATYRESDILTGVEQRIFTRRVTRVDHEADRVELNRGNHVWDLMGNAIKSGDKEFDAPQQFTPAEFHVGKKWTAVFIRIKDGMAATIYYDLQIVRREKVSVPAGVFDAFRIEGHGWNTTHGAQLELRLWLVPGLNFPVKRETVKHNPKGRLKDTERHELVSLRQQAKGT